MKLTLCFTDQATRRSMSLVGIPVEEQEAACRTVAAVLHLGNVDFVDNGDADSSTVAPAAAKHLDAAAKLLGVDRNGLLKSLTSRTRNTVDGAPCPPYAGLSGCSGPLIAHRERVCCCRLFASTLL